MPLYRMVWERNMVLDTGACQKQQSILNLYFALVCYQNLICLTYPSVLGPTNTALASKIQHWSKTFALVYGNELPTLGFRLGTPNFSYHKPKELYIKIWFFVARTRKPSATSSYADHSTNGNSMTAPKKRVSQSQRKSAISALSSSLIYRPKVVFPLNMLVWLFFYWPCHILVIASGSETKSLEPPCSPSLSDGKRIVELGKHLKF